MILYPDIMENDRQYEEYNWIFQQNGASLLCALPIRQYLDQHFARH